MDEWNENQGDRQFVQEAVYTQYRYNACQIEVIYAILQIYPSHMNFRTLSDLSMGRQRHIKFLYLLSL